LCANGGRTGRKNVSSRKVPCSLLGARRQAMAIAMAMGIRMWKTAARLQTGGRWPGAGGMCCRKSEGGIEARSNRVTTAGSALPLLKIRMGATRLHHEAGNRGLLQALASQEVLVITTEVIQRAICTHLDNPVRQPADKLAVVRNENQRAVVLVERDLQRLD
jgi:hypothetical protein